MDQGKEPPSSADFSKKVHRRTFLAGLGVAGAGLVTGKFAFDRFKSFFSNNQVRPDFEHNEPQYGEGKEVTKLEDIHYFKDTISKFIDFSKQPEAKEYLNSLEDLFKRGELDNNFIKYLRDYSTYKPGRKYVSYALIHPNSLPLKNGEESSRPVFIGLEEEYSPEDEKGIKTSRVEVFLYINDKGEMVDESWRDKHKIDKDKLPGLAENVFQDIPKGKWEDWGTGVQIGFANDKSNGIEFVQEAINIYADPSGRLMVTYEVAYSEDPNPYKSKKSSP